MIEHQENSNLGVQDAWKAARKATFRSILIIVIIAIGGFSNLAFFPLLPLKEVGLISIVGIVILLLLTFFALPILNIAFCRWNRKLDFGGFDLEQKFNKIATSCGNVTSKTSIGYIVAIMLCISLFVCYGISNNWLKVGGSPVDYIKDTWTGKSAKYINQEGSGNTTFRFFVTVDQNFKPNSGEVIFDPIFSQAVWKFLDDVKKIEGVSEVYSVLDTVERISEQSFDRPFPNNGPLLRYAFDFIEGNLESDIKDQYYDIYSGYVITVTTNLENTEEWHRICDAILFKLSKNLPIEVLGFGDTLRLVYADQIIVDQMLINILSDIAIIFIVVFFSTIIFIRSLRTATIIGISSTIPFIFATLSLSSFMIIFKIPLEISTALIAPITIAASIDFSVYLIGSFMSLLKNDADHDAMEMAIKHKGGIVIADCVINMVLLLPLVASNFLPIQRIGWMLILNLLFAVIGSLIFMPPMLRKAIR